jgi:hypothetical protein
MRQRAQTFDIAADGFQMNVEQRGEGFRERWHIWPIAEKPISGAMGYSAFGVF